MSCNLRSACSLSAGEPCSVVPNLRLKSVAAVLLGLAVAGVTLLGTGRTGCAGEVQAGKEDPRDSRQILDEVAETYTHFLLTSIGGRFPKSRVSAARSARRPRSSALRCAAEPIGVWHGEAGARLRRQTILN